MKKLIYGIVLLISVSSSAQVHLTAVGSTESAEAPNYIAIDSSNYVYLWRPNLNHGRSGMFLLNCPREVSISDLTCTRMADRTTVKFSQDPRNLARGMHIHVQMTEFGKELDVIYDGISH